MLVDVTRPEFIPRTTVDHVYDGNGYGLLFKAENGNGDVDDDTDMDEAPSDDRDKKQDEVPKDDGGKGKEGKSVDNTSSQVEESNHVELSGGKHVASLPTLVKFGTIDIAPFSHIRSAISDTKINGLNLCKILENGVVDVGLPPQVDSCGASVFLDCQEGHADQSAV
jgi:hypothetical protein